MSKQPVVDQQVVTVARVNGHGFQTIEGDWINLSKYASPAPELPSVGTTVRVGLDKDGYARTVDAVEPATPDAAPAEGKSETISSASTAKPAPAVNTKDLQIARMNALTNAVATLASGGNVIVSEDAVIELAERYANWVLG